MQVIAHVLWVFAPHTRRYNYQRPFLCERRANFLDFLQRHAGRLPDFEATVNPLDEQITGPGPVSFGTACDVAPADCLPVPQLDNFPHSSPEAVQALLTDLARHRADVPLGDRQPVAVFPGALRACERGRDETGVASPPSPSPSQPNCPQLQP